MAISVVRTAQTFNSNGNVAPDLLSNITAGNSLVIVFCGSNNSITSVQTDELENLTELYAPGASGVGEASWAYGIQSPSANSQSVTVTFGASGFWQAFLLEISGWGGTAVNGTAWNEGSGTTPNSNAISLTAGSLMVGSVVTIADASPFAGANGAQEDTTAGTLYNLYQEIASGGSDDLDATSASATWSASAVELLAVQGSLMSAQGIFVNP